MNVFCCSSFPGHEIFSDYFIRSKDKVDNYENKTEKISK